MILNANVFPNKVAKRKLGKASGGKKFGSNLLLPEKVSWSTPKGCSLREVDSYNLPLQMKSCQSHIFRQQRCDALRAAGPAQSYGGRRATKVMLISNQLLLVLNIAQIVDGFECDFAKKSILEELLV